jgi:hypothetical protein
MTNPTVFQSVKKEIQIPEPAAPSVEDDFHQATTPKTQRRNEQRPFEHPSVTTTSSPTEIDPFDVNSPVFASGDPFSRFGVHKSESKESFSVSDPFFDAEDDLEEETPEEVQNLEVPDPPLEHVELLSSDDEDNEAIKVKNKPLELPTPVGNASTPERRIDQVPDGSDRLLPAVQQKHSTVSGSKSVPELKTLKSAATQKLISRSGSGANAASTTTSSLTTEDKLEDKSNKTLQSSERSVPTVAPRLFASVAKSRKRAVVASSVSLPERKNVSDPSTLTVVSESMPTKVGAEPIPKNVDVSYAKSDSKSPKSLERERPMDAREAKAVSSTDEAQNMSTSKTTSILDTKANSADFGKSPSVARSFPDTSDSMDQESLSAAAESEETREPDSVESARLGPSSSAHVNLLLMKRRTEKRRQTMKVQEQENAEKQQASMNKQKQLEKGTGASAYLGRFNPKKSTPTTARDASKDTTSDNNALPPPPPAIERIHADFDREISKLMPKVLSQSSGDGNEIKSKDIERKKSAPPVPEDGSISSSASSYRSRKPRSILRKARRGVPEITPQSSQDINDIVDPMHRAGLRLLAAAIIPIQSAARRFLAKREAVSRLWAIVVIQSYFRRWLAEQALSRHFASIEIQTCFRRWTALRTYNRYRAAVVLQACFRRWTAERWFKQQRAATAIQSMYRGWSAHSSFKRQVDAAIAIQTLFRGWFARDCLLYQHYSAMQIQRMARGYLATIYVYEYIYKVTIVQSCYRRKMAIDDAAYRLSFIMQLQSIVRGYLARRNLAVANQKAVVLQAAWRCYYGRMSYRFDLIDIIIVQNYWRRTLAQRLVSKMRNGRMVRSATKIQAQWRSYDCTMNYLHYLADVLIVQSAARRWIARRHVSKLRFVKAVTIQKTARSFLVRNRRKKHKAAVAVQRTWRGFVCYADYMFTVADIVIVQTRVRRLLAKRETETRRSCRNFNAAVQIQRRWRGFADYQRALVMQADIIICQVRVLCCRSRSRINF